LINGDISNETSPRLIVLIDAVADSEVSEKKGLFKTSLERTAAKLKAMELSQLWNLSNKYGLSVELAAFESEYWTQDLLDKFMDRLERRGANPFNYAELYPDIDEFLKDMPYRANLKGVVDLPGRAARYGSFGIELNNL
jgi:RecB family exonuclease